jgi:hypothetical protein
MRFDLTPSTLSSWRVVNITKTAVWLRLPPELRRPIDGCICPFCAAHPGRLPTWDTLAVPLNKKGYGTWTIHAPEYL